MKLNILILISTIIVNVNCGIFDWFRSKPSWISKIDKYPLIEAFQPHGLRVSIGDVDGLEKFGFHGKLNQCFGRGEDGAFFGYVTEPNNGRWVFVDEHIHLKVGDALHFWIYVKVNGEEHSFSKDVRIINNLIPKPKNFYALDTHPTIATPTTQLNHDMCPCDQINVLSTYASTSSMFPNGQQTPSINSENIICKSQVDSLTEVLLVMLKDEIQNPNLVLTGADEISSRSAMDEILGLFTDMELFDLNGKIKLAYFMNCGIYFEMSSIVDKKRIMIRASTDLKNSKYKFIEPTSAQCDFGKNNVNEVDIRIKDIAEIKDTAEIKDISNYPFKK